ncbi:MAG: HIT family protein [Elusimicrobia bacterium]|nr:HIT family protein [Elusimicrobiota bacterium]
MTVNCLFCRKAIENNEALTVFKDKDVVIVLDIYPRTKGHLVVATTQHYESMYDVPEAVLANVFRAMSLSCKVLKEYGSKGINIGANIGKVAGQQVPHFHIHVIPRYEKDDAIEIEPAFKDTPWRQKSLNLPEEEMKEICTNLKVLYDKINKKT